MTSMIVFGADIHKRWHTIAAVAAASGELVGEQSVQVGAKGFAALLVWARGLGGERVWAIEDCRHVSGSFERFVIGRGERVLRVTTKLMADPRRRARGRGHRRDRGRPGGAARRPRRVAGGAARSPRAGPSALGRSSRAADPPARRAEEHAAVASARHLARLQSARSPAPDAFQATPSSPAPPASPRSPSAPARATATAWTAAATVRSTSTT